MNRSRHFQQGVSMIEVLVTIVIIAFGLLGMAGLQSKLQLSEMEAYQRAQALVLMNDMANRMAVNRRAARLGSYTLADPVGADSFNTGTSTCNSITNANAQAQQDLREWCNAIQGAAVTSSGARAGAVIGGRGCIESVGSNEYMITVAWQGMGPISAPLTSVGCGVDKYDMGGTTGCVNNVCRRVLTTVVRISSLT